MTDAAILDLDEHITRADRAALDGEGRKTRSGGGGGESESGLGDRIIHYALQITAKLMSYYG